MVLLRVNEGRGEEKERDVSVVKVIVRLNLWKICTVKPKIVMIRLLTVVKAVWIINDSRREENEGGMNEWKCEDVEVRWSEVRCGRLDLQLHSLSLSPSLISHYFTDDLIVPFKRGEIPRYDGVPNFFVSRVVIWESLRISKNNARRDIFALNYINYYSEMRKLWFISYFKHAVHIKILLFCFCIKIEPKTHFN